MTANDIDLDDAAQVDEIEIDLDDEVPQLAITAEDEAAPASVKAGAAAIRGFWKHAPKGPGVYRMIGADEEVLYVGKAKSVRKRIASYMRPSGHTNRIARMIALTISMVFVSTATETEALLLETNLIKQLKPRFNVLMRDDKSFPYILVNRRSRGAADHQAPRRAHPEGRLLRAVRQRVGRQPHIECAGAGLPAALVFGLVLREPHAAVPAPPDQALLRPLHRGDQPRRLCGAGEGGPRLSLRQEPRGARPDGGRHGEGVGRAGVRARRAPCATASRRSPPSRASRASTRRTPRRPTSSPSSSRPGSSASKCSSSGPTRTGATARTTRRPTAR